MSTCNKTFFFFKSDVSFIYISDSTLDLSEIRKFCFWISKMLLQAFSDTQNWIYIKKNHIKALQTLWTYPLILRRWYFRLRLNIVHLHRVSSQIRYLTGIFHIQFVTGYLEQVMPLDLHLIDQALSV